MDNLLVGGGMMNFTTYSAFPYFCKNCERLVVINQLAKRQRCPKCRSSKVLPYDHPSLIRAEERQEVGRKRLEEMSGSINLTDGFYYCPSCKEFSMTFRPGEFLWD
jgi:DNA-directed RNA polymerase subunit RPC12/RpoP